MDPQPAAIVAEWKGHLAEADGIGIFGTPTYVIDGELFWGQDRLDFVDRTLKARARADKSAEELNNG